jgi:hypothetical protein
MVSGMRNVPGATQSGGQDPHNNALRKMLGMPPVQNGVLGRNIRDDGFSL